VQYQYDTSRADVSDRCIHSGALMIRPTFVGRFSKKRQYTNSNKRRTHRVFCLERRHLL